MLKRILQFGLIAAVIGSGIGYYMWNKPHKTIGNPDFMTTATEIVAEFDKDESEAMKKYVGKDGKTIVVQVSGKIADVKNDTSGITIAFETGDPINGVSCVLDRFTKHPRTDFKVGEEIKLKGLCTGKLSDVVFDRCVAVE
jgi:tRNA_anti-like